MKKSLVSILFLLPAFLAAMENTNHLKHTEINFSNHAIQRMLERGVTRQDVRNAITQGKRSLTKDGTTKAVWGSTTVIFNNDNIFAAMVITAWSDCSNPNSLKKDALSGELIRLMIKKESKQSLNVAEERRINKLKTMLMQKERDDKSKILENPIYRCNSCNLKPIFLK